MARLFDGNAANYMVRASCDLGLHGATECSIAFWFNITSTAASQRIIDKQLDASNPATPFRIQYDPGTNALSFLIGNIAAGKQAIWYVTAPSTGVWTRVLFTWKRNALTSADAVVYYNGVSQSIATFTPTVYDATFTLQEASHNLYYGVRPISLTSPLSAALGWVCVWNRQLTAQEALLDYINPRNVKSGLVSIVELSPDVDQGSLGGSMTVNGTLASVGGPPVASAATNLEGLFCKF